MLLWVAGDHDNQIERNFRKPDHTEKKKRSPLIGHCGVLCQGVRRPVEEEWLRLNHQTNEWQRGLYSSPWLCPGLLNIKTNKQSMYFIVEIPMPRIIHFQLVISRYILPCKSIDTGKFWMFAVWSDKFAKCSIKMGCAMCNVQGAVCCLPKMKIWQLKQDESN